MLENNFMNIRNSQKNGFTLIELLMVIAIIGILAGILIPAVGAVKKQANIAAGKSQLGNYTNAIELFKGEYKYYPDFGQGRTGSESYEISLGSPGESRAFITGLSGRSPDGSTLGAAAEDFGNRRRIGFYSFSENEFLEGNSEGNGFQLADRFDNVNIVIVIDSDGNGVVDPAIASREVRAPVTAYVEEIDESQPGYFLWDE